MIMDLLYWLVDQLMSAVDALSWNVPEALLLVYAVPIFVLAGVGSPRRLLALTALTLCATVVRVWADGIPYFPYSRWFLTGELQAISLYLAAILLLLTRSPIAMAGPLIGWALTFAVSIPARWLEVLVFGHETGGIFTDRWRMDVAMFFAASLSLLFWHGATAIGLYIWMRRRRGSSALPICSRCRYPLSGLTNPAACPECGASFTPPSPRRGEGEGKG